MGKLFNRARMTTATTGTGTITLGSAVSGYIDFATAGVANSDVVSYCIEEGTNWEVGTGTYTSAGTTLSRTVTKSSAGGTTAITLAGAAQVFITPLAADLFPVPVANGGTGATTLTGLVKGNGTSAMTAAVAGTDYVGVTTANSLTGSGGIVIAGTGSLGFATGSGGTVTQATSKSTGVTLNKMCGTVTMNAASLANTALAAFTLTNSNIAATDNVVVSVSTPVSAASNYLAFVGQVSAGSCSLAIRNNTAGALAEAVILTFTVLKGATA